MTNMTIPYFWYKDICDKTHHLRPYIYQEERGSSMETLVEVDMLDEEEFEQVSKEQGWM